MKIDTLWRIHILENIPIPPVNNGDDSSLPIRIEKKNSEKEAKKILDGENLLVHSMIDINVWKQNL